MFIPTWVGDRYRYDPRRYDESWEEGYVFSDKPVKRDPNNPSSELHVPVPCRIEDAPRNVSECSRVMFLGEPIGKGRHWYPVDPLS